MVKRLGALAILLLSFVLAAGCSWAGARGHTFPGLNYPDGRPIELRDNPAAVNVVYQELAAFLAGIEEPEGACQRKAVSVHDSAEAYGIRAGILLMKLPAGYHTIDIFQTCDRGLVYVDFFYGREPFDLATFVQRYGAPGGMYEFW